MREDRSRFRVGRTYISCTNISDAKQSIEDYCHRGMAGYICVSNPRTVKYATRHEDYRKVMDASLMNIPDAEPMLWAARAWRLKSVDRTMGPVLFKEMLSEPQNGLNHFLMGDTEDTLAELKSKMEKEFEARIVGTYSPPFCALNEYNYRQIAETVKKSGADIVWLSMRAPKQDFFASTLLPFLDKGVLIGVGAAFRFCLGEYKIPNPIITKMGLMGLFWGKKNQTWPAFILGYLDDNVPFLWYLLQIRLWRLAGRKYYE